MKKQNTDRSRNMILASYFNSTPDPQRGFLWTASIDPLIPLIESCEKSGTSLVIFHDCLDTEDSRFLRVSGHEDQAPNVRRWFVYRDWLKKNDVEKVFMVDSTDVVVLNDPFSYITEGVLYVGDEMGEKVSSEWMQTTQQPHLKTFSDYSIFINKKGHLPLLNCGIVGGRRDVVLDYLSKRVEIHGKHTKGCLNSTDMAVFNYIVYNLFGDRHEHGAHINTVFKGFETDNKKPFFRHK